MRRDSMEFRFVPMTLEYAEQIKHWCYNSYVKSVYVEPYFTSFKETGVISGPGGCAGFAALIDNNLAGIFEFYFQDDVIEIGLALSPELTGNGHGKDYVLQGISFGIKKFKYQGDYVQLSVNVENAPAVAVYKKSGFEVHHQKDNEIQMRKLVKH